MTKTKDDRGPEDAPKSYFERLKEAISKPGAVERKFERDLVRAIADGIVDTANQPRPEAEEVAEGVVAGNVTTLKAPLVAVVLEGDRKDPGIVEISVQVLSERRQERGGELAKHTTSWELAWEDVPGELRRAFLESGSKKLCVRMASRSDTKTESSATEGGPRPIGS